MVLFAFTVSLLESKSFHDADKDCCCPVANLESSQGLWPCSNADIHFPYDFGVTESRVP